MKEIPLLVIGSEVITACGGKINLVPDTPGAIYKGHWVFFCLPDCRNQFDQDPSSSCLAEQLLNIEEEFLSM